MVRTLDFVPALERPDLLAEPVRAALAVAEYAARVEVAPIDPELADTAAFCAEYGIGLEVSANCLVVAGTRGEATRYAACMVLATTRLDVNTTVRKLLDARKASFVAVERAVELTGMEYGGITPIGLPASWQVFVDSRIVSPADVIIGAGSRGAKLSLAGDLLAALPGATVIAGLARDIHDAPAGIAPPDR